MSSEESQDKAEKPAVHPATQERRSALDKLMKMRLSVSSDSGDHAPTAVIPANIVGVPGLEGAESKPRRTPPIPMTSQMSTTSSNISSSPLQHQYSSQSSAIRTPVDRKESYKAQRKTYAREKKRVERELLSTFKDQSIIVLADWLKVRGTLKSWTKLWCVLKPGLLLIYRSQKSKSSHWIGTIILSSCELIERPSKKDGFCFKLFHPMDQSIWANRGPEGETYGAVVQPLPTSHLIFRAPNNAAGKCWMDALELALRCSSLLLRTMSSGSGDRNHTASVSSAGSVGANNLPLLLEGVTTEAGNRMSMESSALNESDVENHFKGEFEDGGGNSSGAGSSSEHGDETNGLGMACSDDSDFSEDTPDGLGGRIEEVEREPEETVPEMTSYRPDPSDEVFGNSNDQTEEFSDENKSIVWFLVKQVRPGMDLSRVVLPTFILEPRSFLDKLSDYHYHASLLSEAIKCESPYKRMMTIVKWYLSGFYKKPKGLKKPYNPIIGETFRCYWEHENGSKTFYIAEQVSHHPPISAFYVTNRQDGFTVSSSILAKSKFYGNSTSAILEGTATLNLLPRGEEYKLTMPYAHCKGILMGTLTMELGGKVTIECSKTGYSTELEFKLRPFLGGGEFTNAVTGKIRLGKETLSTVDGHWDDKVMITEKRTGLKDVLWEVTDEVRGSRLKRFTVPIEDQVEFESVNLWQHVSKAIEDDDQHAATDEKSKLEEAQRAGARERKAADEAWVPKLFELNPMTEQYEYKHADVRAWDPLTDLYQYEKDFIVRTKTKMKTPMVRTQSIVSVPEASKGAKDGNERASVKVRRRRNTKEKLMALPDSSVSAEGPGQDSTGSTIPEESEDGTDGKVRSRQNPAGSGSSRLTDDVLIPLLDSQRQTNERLARVQHSLDVMLYQQRERDSNSNLNRDMALLVILVVMIQAVLTWVMTSKAQAGAAMGDLHTHPNPSPM